ncbi:protein tyrosine phosphatase, putative [Plasmodium chabaudi chabaudi]|uniref:Protein tyrosine phosphatase, putative n=2 Tax=Plasmodium chabaudi TaxID=5825 RepID=A0A077XCP6_PLACU|nr:protein tyrosine phosphatase, putative [Plasmodium chabaudi chabaudi]SCM20804.1 protein tyrosine phosphatase, putative [Plasmodium chabaudi adami]SCM21856.1 protein tyrosine phosphatase, putative [Plasmodium chabaudi chabaudi]SCN60207.1 protein tyrosine phosphatase, putative [Plasmodium chabaudi chabaudi]VTZ68706.1 protein tyrosine phosphatase, putative [Plasmodium chabaudi chabaudi]|eukprot:XP_744736.1 protein tyrosine phosphatase, putative [Plasmodium chabaudi chabaudi]
MAARFNNGLLHNPQCRVNQEYSGSNVCNCDMHVNYVNKKYFEIEQYYGNMNFNMDYLNPVLNHPTRIEHGKIKILILDAPTNDLLPLYIKEMRNYNVTDLVRTCERTYDDEEIKQAGINVHELIFPDGDAPTADIVNSWLDIVNNVIKNNCSVAVHCVAGLGRAPVLASVVLIEFGMDPIDAIVFIRDRRKGAINKRQLQFLKTYKKKKKKKNCLRKCHFM